MIVRAYRPATDRSFVLHSFMKSFVSPRIGAIVRAPQVCRIDRAVIEEFWHDWIDEVLKKGESLVAVDEDDPDFYIKGWLAKCGDLLAYVYVKDLERRKGVAKALLGAAGMDPMSCEIRVSTEKFLECWPHVGV